MPDRLYELILGSLQRQIDKNWTLMWDPKTVAEEIKASVLMEMSSAMWRVHQPPPMFYQVGQTGLIGEERLRYEDVKWMMDAIVRALRGEPKVKSAEVQPGQTFIRVYLVDGEKIGIDLKSMQ